MLTDGDSVADFTAPMAHPDAADRTERGAYTGDDVVEFSLTERLAEGPAVFAFFPGVYSRTCTQELCDFRDWLSDLDELEAEVYGVSVDSPWSQLAFIDEFELQYPMVSGFNNDVISEFGVRWHEGLLAGIAVRTVFVVADADDPTVVYAWQATEDERLPDFDEIEAAVAEA